MSENSRKTKDLPKTTKDLPKTKGENLQIVQILVSILAIVVSTIGRAAGGPDVLLLVGTIVFVSSLIAAVFLQLQPDSIDWIKALNDLERYRLLAQITNVDAIKETYNERVLTLHFGALLEGKKELAAALLEKGLLKTNASAEKGHE
jgi:hypothetical protein